MNRLQNIALQFTKQTIADKLPDDVVICAAVRTPVTKAKRGGLRDTPPQIMLSATLKEVVSRTGIDVRLVDDIAVGNNLQPGAGEIPHRMAMFLAGFPDTTSVLSVNRLCSSGLEACAIIAAKIKSGVIDIGIGAGVQSMSLYDRSSRVNNDKLSRQVLEHSTAKLCLVPMGITSQNVAQTFGVTREQQDELAYQSHQKAAKAQQLGLFKSQIVEVKTFVQDDKGNKKDIIVMQDDGIRKQTSMQGLSKLRAVFKKDGTTTAGNSSQISDGAASVLLARRSVAQRLRLPIVAKFVDYVVKGCPPQIMGIGPAVAIPELLRKTKKTVDDIDIWEINEAFASQAVYCVDRLGIKRERLNPKGGAIAIGHPLGCTGSRQIATLIPELHRTQGTYGVISMCVGTGMGAAAFIQRQ